MPLDEPPILISRYPTNHGKSRLLLAEYRLHNSITPELNLGLPLVATVIAVYIRSVFAFTPNKNNQLSPSLQLLDEIDI